MRRSCFATSPILAMVGGTVLAGEPDVSGITVHRVGGDLGYLANWAGMAVTDDGRVFISAGDHNPQKPKKDAPIVPGNSYVWVYTPATHEIAMRLNIQVDGTAAFDPQGIGHGKIHTPPVGDGRGHLLVSSSYYNEPYDDVSKYEGSILFSLDPKTTEPAACHGVIFPNEGTFAAVYLPSIDAYAAFTLPTGRAQVYSLKTRQVIFQGPTSNMDVRLLASDRQDLL